MFSAIFAKRNSFGHTYVASLNLVQYEIYSYGSNFFPLMCGGPGFYPFEIPVFSMLHNVLSFKAMFLVV